MTLQGLTWHRKAFRVVILSILASAAGLITAYVLMVNITNPDQQMIDILFHAKMAQALAQKGEMLPNGLFYMLATLFSKSLDTTDIVSAMIWITAFSRAVTFFLVYFGLRLSRAAEGENPGGMTWVADAVLAMALMFVFPIAIPVSNHYYVGKIPPLVWHSPTSIMVLPAVLLLFHQSLRYLQTGKKVYLLGSALMTVLNSLIKPSFLLCFITVFSPAVWFLYKDKNKRFGSLLVTSLAIAIVAFQYVFLFIHEPEALRLYGALDHNVEIGFMADWRLFLGNPFWMKWLLALSSSLAFPAALFVLFFKRVRGHTPLLYATLLLAVGLIFTSFLHETGSRYGHGNFFWQSQLSTFVVFLAASAVFWQDIFPNPERNWRHYLTAGVFIMHVCSGIYYIHRFLATGVYY